MSGSIQEIRKPNNLSERENGENNEEKLIIVKRTPRVDKEGLTGSLINTPKPRCAG